MSTRYPVCPLCGGFAPRLHLICMDCYRKHVEDFSREAFIKVSERGLCVPMGMWFMFDETAMTQWWEQHRDTETVHIATRGAIETCEECPVKRECLRNLAHYYAEPGDGGLVIAGMSARQQRAYLNNRAREVLKKHRVKSTRRSSGKHKEQ